MREGATMPIRLERVPAVRASIRTARDDTRFEVDFETEGGDRYSFLLDADQLRGLVRLAQLQLGHPQMPTEGAKGSD